MNVFLIMAGILSAVAGLFLVSSPMGRSPEF